LTLAATAPPQTDDDLEVAALLLAHRQRRAPEGAPSPLDTPLAPMSNSETRFRQAILAARSLHPDLLTQSQKLRLYALFRQSQGCAPDEPPAEKTELAIAKWEAWRDVKGLTSAEAMASYSEIIEGLVAMMAAISEGGDPADDGVEPPTLGDDEQRERAPAARANGIVASDEDGDEGEEEESEEEGYDEDDGEDEEDEEDEEKEVEPKVTQTVWSTAALTVPAGGTIDVPLAFDSSCRCSYSLAIVSGTGPIALHVHGPEPGRPALLSEYKNELDGAFEVPLPPGQSGPAVLTATLDNTASMMTAIEVRCRVCLEPLAELQAKEAYSARAALRGLIKRKEATLHAHTQTYAKVGREAQELQATASRLKEQLVVAESEIKIKYKQLEQGAEMAEIMSQEIHELVCQLRAAP